MEDTNKQSIFLTFSGVVPVFFSSKDQPGIDLKMSDDHLEMLTFFLVFAFCRVWHVMYMEMMHF